MVRKVKPFESSLHKIAIFPGRVGEIDQPVLVEVFQIHLLPLIKTLGTETLGFNKYLKGTQSESTKL